MIKVLANKVLAFSQGEKDSKGNLIRVKTVVGFCELPNWVEKDPYFIAAKKDKSILAVGSSSESETVLKEMEKLEALRSEIAVLEEKRDLMVKGDGSGNTHDPDDQAGPAPSDDAQTDAPPADITAEKNYQV